MAVEPFTPFVVYAPSKSGTTWLQKILDAHPEVRCHFQLQLFPFLDENEVVAIRTNVVYTKFKSPFKDVFKDPAAERKYWVRLRYFQRLRRLLRTGINEQKKQFPNSGDQAYLEELLLETYRAIVPRFLQDVPGKKAYGLKSTTDFDFLFRVYPEAKVITILRDGRDVATSKRFHIQQRGGFFHGDEKSRLLYFANSFSWGKKMVMALRRTFGWFGESAHRSYTNDDMRFTRSALKKFARDWYLTTRYILSFQEKFPEQMHVVRYEELKKNQAAEVAKLFRFLGVASDEEVVRSVMEATDFKKLKGGRQDSFFRKGTTGDWQNYFTEKDKTLFKQQTEGLLTKLGYEKDESW
ncbi:MAG: sulfotransferase [Saprospiraceae bacterium]|nr:sulfotransferase [Saprospiraceae bacterium]MCB0625666.1 sulfotransferase [Saprospiraceae bacterium]MCB0678212.1 sulfotransferase [Saprospiraceae bacterium]MCB0682242.1 sulfotransferase [Saprospiraceae bacterium]